MNKIRICASTLIISTLLLFGHQFLFMTFLGFEEKEMRRAQISAIKEERKMMPKYKTRDDKFLIPFLNWGPNNQIRGFQETLILAIKLNRTICIPLFFKHYTVRCLALNTISYFKDSSIGKSEHLVLPEFRIDVSEIHKLMTTCDASKISKNCRGKIDALLLGRNICSGDIFRTTKETWEQLGLEAFMDGDNCRGVSGVKTYPEDDELARVLSTNRTWLKEYYPSGKS